MTIKTDNILSQLQNLLTVGSENKEGTWIFSDLKKKL